MTKVEYIRQLEFSLSGKMSRKEISEILRDYSEYFEAGKAEGKSEEEIVRALGIPSVAAAQILSEVEKNAASAESEKESRRSPWSVLKEFFARIRSGAGRVLEWIKQAFAAVKGWFMGLFCRRQPQVGESAVSGESAAAPEGEVPSAADYRTDEVQNVCLSNRAGCWTYLLQGLGMLCLLPFILLGIVVVGCLLFAVLALIFALLVCAGVCAMGLFFGVSGVTLVAGMLPTSAGGLLVVMLIALASGGALMICLALLLVRACYRGIRRLFAGAAKRIRVKRERKGDFHA